MHFFSIKVSARYRLAFTMITSLIDPGQRQGFVIHTLLVHEAKKEQTQVHNGKIHQRRPSHHRRIAAQAWPRNGAGDSTCGPSFSAT